MSTQSIKRTTPTALYYVAGFLFTYLVAEWEKPYGHGPTLWMLLALLLFAVGVIWTLVNALQVFAGKKEYLLSLALHVTVVSTILTSLFLEVRKEPTIGYESDFNEITILHADSTSEDVVIINAKGDTLQYNFNDSAIGDKLQLELNKRDHR